MIDLDFLERLIRAVDESGIDSVEIERGGTRLRIAKTPSGASVVAPAAPSPMALSPHPVSPPVVEAPPAAAEEPAPAAPPEPSNIVEVTSPMVGTFYRAANPDADPYVEVGRRVAKGDTLCIIEAMKLMNELESEVDGVIASILVANGEPVEYGQALFRIELA